MNKFKRIEEAYNKELRALEGNKNIEPLTITHRTATPEEKALITAFRKEGVHLGEYISYCIMNYDVILGEMLEVTTPDYIKEYYKANISLQDAQEGA